MIRAVLDTNVLISAMEFGGLPEKIYMAWERNEFTLVLSEYILDEFARIAKYKVRFDLAKLNLALTNLYNTAEIAEPIPVQHPDIFPNDWPILGTAVAGKADFLVTGDKKILKLRDYLGVKILNPKQFLQKL